MSTTAVTTSDYKILEHFVYGTPLNEEQKNQLADLSKECLIGGIGFPLAINAGTSVWKSLKAEKGEKLKTFKDCWTKKAPTAKAATAATDTVKAGTTAAAGTAKAGTTAAAETATGVAKAGSKCLKFVKGNALFAVISAAMETPDIISAYQTDTSTGNKQLMKSGLKVAVGVGGFAAGSALAGMALGAACGSVVPVVGNIVGAIGGLIVGAAANYLTGWLWDKNYGEGTFDKSEAQVVKETNGKRAAACATTKDLLNDTEALLAQSGLINEKGEFTGTEEEYKALKPTLDAYQNIANQVNYKA